MFVGNLEDEKTLHEIPKQDVVVHIAGITHAKKYSAYYNGNVKTTINLIDYCQKLGIKHFFSAINRKTIKKINNIFKDGADICFESAGLTKTIEFGMKIVNKNGKLHFASHPNNKDFIKLSPHDLIKGKKISGSWGGGSKPDRDIKRFLPILNKKNFNILNFNVKIYKLNEINHAIEDFRKNLIFRPIIKMEHSI